jgi:hypothetical protein
VSQVENRDQGAKEKEAMKHGSIQLGARKNPDSLRVHGLRFTAIQSSLSSVSSFSPDGRSSLGEADRQEYFSIPDLAKRWRCSRGTVYNRLRTHGAKGSAENAPAITDLLSKES